MKTFQRLAYYGVPAAVECRWDSGAYAVTTAWTIFSVGRPSKKCGAVWCQLLFGDLEHALGAAARAPLCWRCGMRKKRRAMCRDRVKFLKRGGEGSPDLWAAVLKRTEIDWAALIAQTDLSTPAREGSGTDRELTKNFMPHTVPIPVAKPR
jgi:hypothetical protein